MTMQDEIMTDRIPHPSEYLTITGVIRAVSEGPQTHAEGRSRDRRVPVWAVACIVFGSPLMVLGCLATDPVARVVWELIPR